MTKDRRACALHVLAHTLGYKRTDGLARWMCESVVRSWFESKAMISDRGRVQLGPPSLQRMRDRNRKTMLKDSCTVHSG